MLQLLTAMGTVLVTWFGLFVVFVGLGLLVRRCLAGGPKTAEQLLLCFWLGYASIIFVLQIWHLAFPVDYKGGLLLVLFSIIGLLMNGQDVLVIIKRLKYTDYVLVIFVIVAAVFFANRAIGPPLSGDTGSYHLNTIGWITQYPIIPGLGNLHGRLAFNQSHFLYAALLENCLWSHRSFHFTNGLLIVVFVVHVFAAGYKIVTSMRGWAPRHLFTVIMALPIFIIMQDFTSCSPDLPVFIMGILICAKLFDLLSKESQSDRELTFSLAFIVIMSALGVTLKMSFIMQGGLATLVALYFWFRSISDFRAKFGKNLGLVVLCWSAFLIPWMARGVLLSGYVAYPSTLGAFDIEWAVPHENVVQMERQIKGWARMPGGTLWRGALDTWDWIVPWFRRLVTSGKESIQVAVPLTIALLMFSYTLLSHLVRRKWCATSWWRHLILMPWLGGIVFWFFTAPDPRFLGAAGWILAASSVTLIYCPSSQTHVSKLLRVGSCLCFCISVFLVVKCNYHMYGPGPDKGFHPAPDSHLKEYFTKSGLKLYVPNRTACWYGPLVYTPWPDPNIRLREESDLASGFVTEKGGLVLN
jgi:hypothetical protein